MTMFLAPYTAIADIDGSPLDAGFLFFGEYEKDPELFPIEVFWDADFTVPAAQPIRTRNGYPVRNGSPTKVYLKTAQHSIVIKNRNSAFILVDFKNKGWDTNFVVSPSGETQEQINLQGGESWYRRPVGYRLNERAVLANGDIVRSLIPNNTNDPNSDMTGWVKANDASQIFTQTALNQEMFNQKIERQTANHSVNLVDFLTRKQWKDWQEDNESVDFTVALETAFPTMYNSAPFLNGIRWGVGEIILPRGVVRLDLRQIQLDKAYGLIIRGQGVAATQIKTSRAAPTTPTVLNDSLFRSQGYTYLEFADFSVTCSHQDINFIRLNGDGGGRELLMRNVTTQGFKYIKCIEGNANTDTNFVDRCTFGSCVSVVYTRSNQAMINTYQHCTFSRGIVKAFDVTGFGYTVFISCNVVTGGKFYHVASDGSSYFGQVVTFINTKLEHNTDGKSQLLTSDNNPNVYIFAKFIGSGMVSADTPDPSIYQIDVAGKLKIEIDGGEWNKCKFRFGQSIDYNTTVDIKNCSNPPSPTNISFLEYQAGYAYNYPSVNFKNNLNMLDLIVRHEKSTASNFSTQNCISQRGAALLQAGSATPNTRTFDMRGQNCFVNSLDLYIKSWAGITNLRVSVFADAAFTIPMNTEQAIVLPATSGASKLKFNIPLSTQSFADKMYVRITNDSLNGVVIGHFKLDTEFL